MKRFQKLLKDISDLTLTIEEQYPELYRFLDENPISIPSAEHPKLDTTILSDYLETLKSLLNNYIEAKRQEK